MKHGVRGNGRTVFGGGCCSRVRMRDVIGGAVMVSAIAGPGVLWAQSEHGEPSLEDVGGLLGGDVVVRTLGYEEATGAMGSLAWDGGRTELEWVDLNDDGHVDLVTVGDHGSPFIGTQMHGITVWFGNGAGGWNVFQNGQFGYGGVAIGDVNNDDFLDVGFGVHHNYSSSDFGDQLCEVALGDGTGRNWTPWDDGLGLNGQDYGMFGTEFADIDGDGFLDYAGNSFGADDGFHVYRNNGDGTWVQTHGFIGGNSDMDIATGDVNNDGYPDFALSRGDGTVYLNSGGTGAFVKADAGLPSPGGFTRSGVSLGDVDGDGFDDLSFVLGTGGVAVYRWDGVGAWVSASAGLPGNGGYETTQLIDMDRDGRLDVAAFGNRRCTVWRGDGLGGWTGAATFLVPGPGYFSGFRCADTDHNGLPDIAIVSDQGGIFSSQNELQFFRETSEPEWLAVRMTRPTAGKRLRAGSTFFIGWLSAVPGWGGGRTGPLSTVSIEMSLTGPGGNWIQIEADGHDNGQRQVHLPADAVSGNAWFRITVESAGRRAVDVHGPFEVR